MNVNKYSGEILSFIELLKIQRIEIPIIQRDYAQGRKDKKDIRENFLCALRDSIIDNREVKLDFIYGSIVNNSFQPLDGQQRLTTLFLLHWYAASKDKMLDSVNKSILSKFSYETRISSRDFCTELVDKNIQISTNDPISENIINSSWFYLSWKNDPTIDSMLRMIDEIHNHFFEISDLWDKLIKTPHLITFYYVELENIGLSDDLYIKMNARGKLLTPFENFKASFQKHIENKKWEEEISLHESFVFKIDTCWTDLFWHNFRKNNAIDEAFMRFISTIAMIRQSLERNQYKTEERLDLIKKLQEEPSLVKPDHFTLEGFNYLIKCFDFFTSAYNNKLTLNLPYPLWRHAAKTSILSEIVFDNNDSDQTNSATYTQKVLFFAQIEYLLRNDVFDESKYHDWMRVIRNIVSRGDIDPDGKRPDIIRSPQTFDGVIYLVNELSEYCEDIYSNLSKVESLKSQFAKDQIEEEKNKAKLIIFNPSLKNIIHEAEDNELLRGKLSFIFYCMDYTKNSDLFDVDLFVNLKNVFNTYFNSESCLSNDLRRAMLTINVNGFYEFYNYWWSYWHIAGATKRKLFDKFREIEYYIYSDNKEYFKKLVLQLIQKNYQEIISEFTHDDNFPVWKKRLIFEPVLLDSIAKSKYIAIVDDNSCCWLLKSKRPRDIEGNYKVE